ncbi:MAG: amidohydrolase family protein [Ornithinimicrobium sp.]
MNSFPYTCFAERFGALPLEYAESLGWIGEDVWFAHGVHFFADAEVARLGSTRTGVADCPTSNARLGSGIARTRDLRDAGARVGIGVDGAASNEACAMIDDVRHALLFARAKGGPQALSVRDALELATVGGAAVLGRADELGSIELGKFADLALWRIDSYAHADIADPVAALVLGSPPPIARLFVNGVSVVEDERVPGVAEGDIGEQCGVAHQRLLDGAAARGAAL